MGHPSPSFGWLFCTISWSRFSFFFPFLETLYIQQRINPRLMTALLDSKLQLSLVMKIDSPVNRAFRVGCSCKRCFRPLPTNRLLAAARCEESRNRLSFARYAFYRSSLRLSSSITTIVKNALKRRKGKTSRGLYIIMFLDHYCSERHLGQTFALTMAVFVFIFAWFWK